MTIYINNLIIQAYIMICKVFLTILLLSASTQNAFSSAISSFDAITDGIDTKIRVCLSEKQNFKISNNQKAKKLLIEFENIKNSYQFGTKDRQDTSLIKDINSKQDGTNTIISLNTYTQAKIEDFEFNNKTKCLNLRLQNDETLGILNSLKKENMPWFSFEPTKEQKTTTKLVKKSYSPFIAPLKDLSHNIHKIQQNIIAAATSLPKGNGRAANLLGHSAEITTKDTIQTKPYQITKVSDNFSATSAASIKRIIVIDPGHGGQDYGSVNRATKIKEKDITLKYAKSLKALLEHTGRYKIFLTRDSDEFLPLLQRTKIASKKQANLFISLHADGIEIPNLSSTEIYSYNSKASDGESEKLARLENASDYMISNVNFAIEAINYKINPSKKLQASSQKFLQILATELSQSTNSKINSSNHANFMMLKNEKITSALIELGFSSKTDTGHELLTSKNYMQKINNAITKAINEYFESESK